MSLLAPRYAGYIFDLDGTLCRGRRPLPRARETLETLRAEGRRVLMMSNNPLVPAEQHARKLAEIGLPVEPDDVLTSVSVLLDLFRRQPPDGPVFLIGEPPLAEALEAAGIRLSDRPEEVACVVAAFDRTFDYRKWTIAFQAIRRGADFIATNADATYPGDDGEIPDCGGVIAALETSTSVPVRAVLGKPSQDFLAVALRRLGVAPSEAIVVGDRLQTDIAMGVAGGTATALMLTGVTTMADLHRSDVRPTFVLPTLGELLDGGTSMASGSAEGAR